MIFRITGLVLASLVIGVVAQAPAAKLLPRFLAAESEVQLYEINGTVLSGSAQHVRAKGQDLAGVAWDINPLGLLLGRVNANLRLSSPADGSGAGKTWCSADVSLSLAGDHVWISNLSAETALSQIQDKLKIPYSPVDASLWLSLDELEWDLSKQQAVSISGSLAINQTQWKLGTPVSIGDYSAQISGEAGELTALISETDNSQIGLSGQLSASMNEQKYEVDLKIKPKAGTAQNLVNQMKALGRTDQQGWYQIKQSGRIRY